MSAAITGIPFLDVADPSELIDGFAAEGRCEFMSAFAEPYATRVTARLLGIPEEEWHTLADHGGTLGLSTPPSWLGSLHR